MLALAPLGAGAANKPSHPGTLLGSHPSVTANNARLALLKQRSKSVPLLNARTARTANPLNSHPGKTITINRRLPK